MKATKIIFASLISLCFPAELKSQELISAREVVEKFMNVSGGLEKWQDVKTIEYEGATYSQKDSSISKFKEVFRDSILALYLKTYSDTSISDASIAVWTERNFGIKTKKYDYWIDMDDFYKNIGRTYEFQYHKASYCMNFIKKIDSLEYYYQATKTDFGADFYVLESVNKKMESNSDIYADVRQTFSLFSRNSGLLVKVIHMKNGKETTRTEYSQFEDFDGLLFPTTVKTFSGNQISQELEKKVYDNDSVAKILRELHPNIDFSKPEKITTYHKIIINQPIDESVFEMD